jgi:chromosome condensin MukBEF ATPase and DNA-binding subunit MukB
MTDYRRYRIKGGTYFFTVNLEDRKQKLLTERIDALRGAFREIKQAHPFQIDAEKLFEDLCKQGAIKLADNRISYIQKKISELANPAAEPRRPVPPY